MGTPVASHYGLISPPSGFIRRNDPLRRGHLTRWARPTDPARDMRSSHRALQGPVGAAGQGCRGRAGGRLTAPRGGGAVPAQPRCLTTLDCSAGAGRRGPGTGRRPGILTVPRHATYASMGGRCRGIVTARCRGGAPTDVRAAVHRAMPRPPRTSRRRPPAIRSPIKFLL